MVVPETNEADTVHLLPLEVKQTQHHHALTSGYIYHGFTTPNTFKTASGEKLLPTIWRILIRNGDDGKRNGGPGDGARYSRLTNAEYRNGADFSGGSSLALGAFFVYS